MQIFKNRIFDLSRKKRARMILSIILFAVLTVDSYCALDVHAYNYAMTGASAGGNVTITELNSSTGANGYTTLGGYRVDYSVTAEWVAFYDALGGFFYTGSSIDPSGGCHFCYCPSGTIWEDGALNLGVINGGSLVGSVHENLQTVSCSFNAGSLSEIPNYIAYCYNPAGGAYIHISEERGDNAHVWYYADLKNVPVTTNPSIDRSAPLVNISAAPSGTVVTSGGIRWGTSAVINVRSEDNQSRPGGIRVYKDGVLIKTIENSSNDTVLSGNVTVTENGNYSAESYDKVGNISSRVSVSVSCIDKAAPGVSLSAAPTSSVVTNPANGSKWGNKALITAAANDSQSFPAGIRIYQGSTLIKTLTNSADNPNFTGSFEVGTNGTYSAEAFDKTGNVSTRQSVTVSCIDTVSPVISTFTADTLSYAKKITLSVGAADSGCGLHNIPYMYDTSWVASPKYEVTENGTYTVKVRDGLNNMSTKSITVNNIDNTPPVINSVTKSTDGFAKSVKVTIDASDEGSGLHETPYGHPDDGWYGENEITISENGVYIIRVRDALGNEVQDSFTIDNVDNTPPKIDEVKKEVLEDGNVRITVTASDNEGGSGLDDKPYSFDGGKTWQEDNTYITDKNGEVEILVRDRLDQRDDDKIEVTEIKKKDEGNGNNGNNGNGDGNNDNGNDDERNKGNGDNNGGNGSNGDDGNNGNGNNGNGDGSGDNGNGNPPSGNDDKREDTGDNVPAPSAGEPAAYNSDVNDNAVNNDPFISIADTDRKNIDNTKKPPKKKRSDEDKTDKDKNDNDSEGDPVSDPDRTDDTDDTVRDKINRVLKEEKETVTEVEPDELLSDNTKEADSIEKKEKKMSAPQKVAVALIAFLIVMGLLGLLLYLWLFYFKRSAILFGLDDKGRKKYLARLFINTDDEGEWYVNVPDHKLGDLGTGDYALKFSPGFLAVSEDEDILINIDGRTIRERIKEEVRFFI